MKSGSKILQTVGVRFYTLQMRCTGPDIGSTLLYTSQCIYITMQEHQRANPARESQDQDSEHCFHLIYQQFEPCARTCGDVAEAAQESQSRQSQASLVSIWGGQLWIWSTWKHYCHRLWSIGYRLLGKVCSLLWVHAHQYTRSDRSSTEIWYPDIDLTKHECMLGLSTRSHRAN